MEEKQDTRNEGITRREFIEQATTITSGLMLSGVLSQAVLGCQEDTETGQDTSDTNIPDDGVDEPHDTAQDLDVYDEEIPATSEFSFRDGDGDVISELACDRLAESQPDNTLPQQADVPEGYHPNILLVATDQEQPLHWLDDRVVDLHARSWLRKWGIEFTNAHCNTLPCSPSRSSLYTGLYAHQHHIYGNCGYSGTSLAGFPTSASILLAEYGYNTFYVGKSHLASNRQYGCTEDPLDGHHRYGFMEWVTAPESEPIITLAGREYEIDWPSCMCYDSFGSPREGWHEDRRIATHGISLLKQLADERPDRPWFVAIGLVNPHDIMWYPETLQGDFDDPWCRITTNAQHDIPTNFEMKTEIETYKPTCQEEYINVYNLPALGGVMVHPSTTPDHKDEDPAYEIWKTLPDEYLRWLKCCDNELKRLILQLLALPVEERRKIILLFTSDHGEMLGSHGQRAKGPNMYEEQMNVPLLAVDFSSAHFDQMHDLVLTGLGSHALDEENAFMTDGTYKPEYTQLVDDVFSLIEELPVPESLEDGRYITKPGTSLPQLTELFDVPATIISLGAGMTADDNEELWRATYPQVNGANLLKLLKNADPGEPVMVVPRGDPEDPSDVGTTPDEVRDHILGSSDSIFGVSIGGISLGANTAPHIIHIHKQVFDQNHLVADYKLSLNYQWEEPDMARLRDEEYLAAFEMFDPTMPYEAELYDVLRDPDTSDADYRRELEINNLVPRELAREVKVEPDGTAKILWNRLRTEPQEWYDLDRNPIDNRGEEEIIIDADGDATSTLAEYCQKKDVVKRTVDTDLGRTLETGKLDPEMVKTYVRLFRTLFIDNGGTYYREMVRRLPTLDNQNNHVNHDLEDLRKQAKVATLSKFFDLDMLTFQTTEGESLYLVPSIHQ